MITVTPLADPENQKMSIRKYTTPDGEEGSLAGIVTKHEIKTHFERQGIKIGVINIATPIRKTGDHSITIDGFPVCVSVEGYN